MIAKLNLTIEYNKETGLVNSLLEKSMDFNLSKNEANGMILSGIGELVHFFEEYSTVLRYKK